MCLLDAALRWDAREILCRARSHLDPGNPLRAGGRLGAAAGIEYGLQAAALHGALRALADGAAPPPPGWFAALRETELRVPRLDVASFGALDVRAWLERAEAGGLIYRFALRASGGASGGALLVRGRAVIVLPTIPVSPPLTPAPA